MGLKFRRGTNAQKSGSLAFGEPYVNTDLGTLQIGGLTGDITLGASGTGSAGSFSSISGSGLDITGNANVAGNLTLGGKLTIGDNTSDTVNVIASLSSSLIPSLDSIFDLGSPSKQWRDLYLSSASLYIDGTQVLSSTATELIFTTDTGQGIKFNELGTDNITLQTVDGDIELKSSGGGDVLLDPTTGIISVKGNVSMQDGTSKFLSSGGTNIVFGNDLIVTGSITTTANANIAGNLTIGDSSSDIVNVIASISSSLIPSVTNTFDLGSPTKFWRDLYISTGSIKFVGAAGTVVGTLSNAANGLNLDGGVVANGNSTFGTSSAAITSVTGSLLVNGNVVVTNGGITGSIRATNGVVSGSSQVVGILSSLNEFSASENTKSETLRLYTASVDTKFTSLATYTGSNDTTNTTQNTRLSRIEESTSSLNAYTASNNTTNTLQTTRIDQLAAGTASVNLQTASVAGHITDINTYTSSLKTAFSVSGTDLTVIGNLTVQGDTVTLNVSNLLVEDKVIEIASGSTTSAAANGAGIFISGANASILWDNASSTLDINKSIDVVGNVTLTGTVDGVDVSVQDTLYTNKFSTLQTYTASVDSTLARLRESTASLNAFSASENTKSETLRLYTASIDGKFSTLATYTGSNDTTNTTQNTRLTRLEESTASINLTTSSLATTYEGRATAAKTIFSGSSQVVGSAITTNTITIGSTSTALGGTSTTLAGLTSVTSTGFTGALTGNASTATTLATARTINGTSFNGSADITIANLVSGSAQIDGSQLGSNKTITVGSTAITLGGTATTIAGLTSVTSTGFTGALTGNASTATTLATARNINGVSFNGSADITVTAAAGTLSGATLAAGVTASSLTSVGTLTTLTVSGATATGALTVTGAITATGDITAFFTSDKRHKNNIQTIPNALEKVTKLNGVTWEWNDDVNEVTKSTPKTGLIAQEVQEVLPEVVKTRDDGFLALDYSKMMGLLVEAIKEQQIQIEELKAQIGSK